MLRVEPPVSPVEVRASRGKLVASTRATEAPSGQGRSPVNPLEPPLTLESVREENRAAFRGIRQEGLPPRTYPEGLTKPEGEGTLGHQVIRAAQPEAKLNPSPIGAPFAHESGQNPILSAAMARTMGRPEPRPWTQRLFQDGIKGFVKEFFIPLHELKGKDIAAYRGDRAVPKTEFYAQAADIIRQLAGEKRNQQRLALGDLTNITGGLRDAEDSHLFQTKVFVDEMAEALNRGEMPALPGLAKDEAAQLIAHEQVRLQPILDANPSVQAAYERHLKLQRAVGNELASRGLIADDQRQFYMQHVVLDYLKEVRGQVQRGLRLPNIDRILESKARGESGRPGLRDFTPGQLKARNTASVRDISRDYLGVQYQYLATTYEAIKRYDLIRELGRKYDIRNNPKVGAEEYSTLPYEQGDSPPPGYTRYDLHSGFSSLRGNTMAERIMGRVLDENGTELADLLGFKPGELESSLLTREEVLARAAHQLKAAAVKADLENSVVIPDELADVLRRAASNVDAPDIVARASKGFIRTFKSVVLQKTPIQYNVRNALGDFQRAYAQFGTNMMDGKLWKDAIDDIWGAYRHQTYSFDMQKMQELNVSASGMTGVEVAGVHNIPQFQHLARMEGNKVGLQMSVGDAMRTLSGLLPRLSEGREDVIRAVIYKMNDQRIQRGEPLLTGIVDVKGLDIPAEELVPADRLSNAQLDLRRRASAKVARQSLIDYGGDFTVAEERLRNSIIPFYSWIKGNMVFWPRLAMAVSRGTAKASDASAAAALQGAVGLTAYLAAVHVWNNWIMGDAEAALPEFKQRRGHVILPDPSDPTRPWLQRDEQGKAHIVTVNLPDALDDFNTWVGLNGVAPELRALLDGRMNWKEYMRRRGSDVVTAPARGLGNALGPSVQAPLAAAGIQLFPDPLNPRVLAPGERTGATLNALGLGGFGMENFVAQMPEGTSPLDVPKQLGIGTSLANPEDSFVKDLRIERSHRVDELNQLKQHIGRIQSGTALPELDQDKRAARVAQFQRLYDSKVSSLQNIDRRLGDLSRTARLNSPL